MRTGGVSIYPDDLTCTYVSLPTQAERERGITIDIALWKFESPKVWSVGHCVCVWVLHRAGRAVRARMPCPSRPASHGLPNPIGVLRDR